MIFYGSRASNIGNYEVKGTPCSYCESKEGHIFSVFGRYAHIYWIPLFPIGKVAVAECNHCKKTSEKKEFNAEMNQAYEQNKELAKRPFWHWAGLILIGILVAAFSIIDSNTVPDPRDELLDADIEMMTTSPSMETDSISSKIKFLFDISVTEEMSPDKFEYFTEIQEDKALVLVKIPDLKDVEKSSRAEVIEMVEMITNEEPTMQEKDIYIGIHGKYNFMLVKTPTEYENSRIVVSSKLYDYYGPEIIVNDE